MTFGVAPFRDLYPFESRFLDRGGARMHYVDEGEGEPVVLLHGNPTWSFLYRELIADLRESHRAIAPDWIGCGLSDKPPARAYDYRLKSRVEDLDALLSSLGVGRGVTLAMHDWGGAIGMAWAARNAERVARLILFNTAAFTMPPGKRMPWQLRLARTPPIGAIAVRGFNAFVRGTLEVALTDGADERVRRAYLAPHDSWANRIATLRFVQDIPLSPSDLSYPLLIEAEKGIELFRDRPALICWGGRDFVFDRVFFDRWRGLLPDAETHWFENAGHLVLEDASEQIRSIVRRFLTAHPLEGAPG